MNIRRFHERLPPQLLPPAKHRLTLFSFADLSHRRRPSRAVSSPGRASASAAAAGAADPLARRRTRPREASTSQSTTGISATYRAFQPSQRFDAIPRHRNDLYRDFFGGVLSDLRPSGNVGRPSSFRRCLREDLRGRPLAPDLRQVSDLRHKHAVHISLR